MHKLWLQEGKVITSTTLRGVTVEDLGNGSELLMSSFEVEIDSELAGDKFRLAWCSLHQQIVRLTCLGSG